MSLRPNVRSLPRAFGLFVVLTVVAVAGCARQADETTATTDEASDTDISTESAVELPPQPSTETPAEAPQDPLAYEVPSGSPEELVEFINTMARRQPRGATPDEQTADVGRAMDARIRAAELLLQEADQHEFASLAARTKLESLRVLRTIGRAGAKADFQAYADQLAAAADPQFARIGRLGHFHAKVDAVMMMEEADAMTVVAALDDLLQQEQHDQELMGVASNSVGFLLTAGKNRAAQAGLLKIGQAFADHADPALASKAQAALQRAQLLGFQLQIEQAVLADEEARQALVAEAGKLLAAAENSTPLMLIMQSAENLEYSGHVALAQQLYAQIQQAVEDRTEAELPGELLQQLAAAQRRVGLLGKPFEIEGQLLDGEAFDWGAYRDRVVLVDFWATWCQPCIRELPNIRAQYDKYHDRGFDVVGINLDENREAVEQFLAQQQLPWVSLVNASSEEMEFRDPNAQRYGVEGIPFLVLVDRAGMVAGLHVRGELLGDKLAEMLDSEPRAGDTDTSVPEEAVPDVTEKSDAADALTPSVTDGTGTEAVTAGPGQAVATHKPLVSEEDAAGLSVDQQINPYAPPAGLSPRELADYLLELQDKPRSIQSRQGFREGICLAADALLTAAASDQQRAVAATAKLDYLHRDACLGNEEAERLLRGAVDQLQHETLPQIVAEVRFLQLERRAIDASQIAADKLPAVIDECTGFLGELHEALTSRQLRMASATIAAINRLEDAPLREQKFQALARVLSASNDKAVARYGRRIGKQGEQQLAALIGQPFELWGTTLDGDELAWEDYRGRVVLVDFWASWCGPCKATIPQLQSLLDAHETDGLDIVGVCLDEDEAAARAYVANQHMPWPHLTGAAAAEIADRYHVHGIPFLALVDREGHARHFGTDPAALHHALDELLGVDHDDQ